MEVQRLYKQSMFGTDSTDTSVTWIHPSDLTQQYVINIFVNNGSNDFVNVKGVAHSNELTENYDQLSTSPLF